MKVKLRKINTEEGFATLCLFESQLFQKLNKLEADRYVDDRYRIIRYSYLASLDNIKEMNEVINNFIVPRREFLVGPPR